MNKTPIVPSKTTETPPSASHLKKPKFKFPTEMVDLPSRGLIYAKDNPLSSGKIEMKYMTAKEEDIITNQSYISKGTVIEKLLEALVVSDVNIGDMIVGDKNALLVASRVLGYGASYKFTYAGEDYEVDLSTLDNKHFDETLFTQGENRFSFQLPSSETLVEFQLMTDTIEKKVEAELRGLKKLKKEVIPEMSTRMKHMILSVDGNMDKKDIREFVDTYFLARDAKALRDYIGQIQPDVDFSFEREKKDGEIEEIDIPIGANFFFPDA
jgi:hypothetical protein